MSALDWKCEYCGKFHPVRLKVELFTVYGPAHETKADHPPEFVEHYLCIDCAVTEGNHYHEDRNYDQTGGPRS